MCSANRKTPGHRFIILATGSVFILFLFHRVADLRDKIVRVLRLMWADVVILCKAVNFSRFQKTNLIIVAEHPDTDPGQL